VLQPNMDALVSWRLLVCLVLQPDKDTLVSWRLLMCFCEAVSVQWWVATLFVCVCVCWVSTRRAQPGWSLGLDLKIVAVGES
jgi:hypothetical protein